MARARALMVQGCSSNAGKSYLVAGLCRLFAGRGLRVLPFKGQNMSNNAGVTPSGGEIGRAQLLQAQAVRVTPDVRMNPVLVKPESRGGSQVVVLGQADPVLSKEPWQARKSRLWPVVRRSLGELMAECDLVIIEGAGSPAEINLKSGDIVNMRVAREANAAVLLAADIDRGGAFAHLLGTWHCLDGAERELLAGFVLNKFRGDPKLLGNAPAWLEQRTGVPVLGTVPYLPLPLPDEDVFSLEAGPAGAGSAEFSPARSPGSGSGPAPSANAPLVVAVVRLPHLSNFDEFDPLRHQQDVELRWITEPAGLAGADVVILPGSKAVSHDLAWLRSRGLAEAIVGLAAGGTPVHGICGGLQMLGRVIRDPLCVEGGGTTAGLGLLELETEMAPEKTVRLACARLPASQESLSSSAPGNALDNVSGRLPGYLSGYEIHHGRSLAGPNLEAFLEGGLGYRSGNVSGVYLHGLFDHPAFRRWMLGREDGQGVWPDRVDEALDRLAEHLDAHLPDLGRVLERRPVEKGLPAKCGFDEGDRGCRDRDATPVEQADERSLSGPIPDDSLTRSVGGDAGPFLILGGARSGKSAYAESLARRLAGHEVTYLATLEAGDEEMRRRVARHRGQRPAEWQTVEAGRDIVDAVGRAEGRVLLLDCLSGLVANLLLDAGQPGESAADEDVLGQAVAAELELLLAALAGFPGNVIVVSNEVGSGVVPPTPLGRRFRDELGRANQTVAAWSETVVLLTAGLPSAIKGTWPRLDEGVASAAGRESDVCAGSGSAGSGAGDGRSGS